MSNTSRSTQRKRENKVKSVEYLGNQCFKCGRTGHPAIFDFHHRNPKEKEYAPSILMGRRWETIKEELDRCDLLCANCHAVEHHGEESWKEHKNPVSRSHKKTQIILKESHCGRCPVCSEARLSALTFHHIAPKEKEIKLGDTFKSLKRRIEESKKCMLLCHNCHRNFHAGVSKFAIRHTFDNALLERSKVKNKYRQRRRKKTEFCKECGVKFESCHVVSSKRSQSFCSRSCKLKASRRVKRPSREELEILITENSFLSLGRQFGVSDNAVRKWAKGYGIL